MKIWVDAQLPPTLANWLSATFGLESAALRDLSLRDAQDIEIFEAARAENAVIMTKDSDFIDLVCRLARFDMRYRNIKMQNFFTDAELFV